MIITGKSFRFYGPLVYCKVLLERFSILFNVFRRVHSKQFEELLPEIFAVADADPESGLIHIALCIDE